MTNSNQKPVYTLRDRALKATIWRNQSEKGAHYSVQFTKIYTASDQQVKDTHSFSQSDLLRLSYMATKAYDLIAEYRENDKLSQPTTGAL